MTILGLLGGTAVAVAGWIQVRGLATNPRSQEDKIALYFMSIVYTLLAVVALFG